jgi:tetratricopeptide (TPR) repeat protein
VSHPGQESMRRLLAGEGGPQEAEAAAQHILSCDRCRVLAGNLLDQVRAINPGLRGEGPLHLVFAAIDQERRWGVESLAALVEWTDLRCLPSRRSQRDRVRMRKPCHTIAFFRLVLAELKEEPSWEEAEFLAGLALLCAEAMSQRDQITQSSFHDLQTEGWTAVANARRRAAEWKRAHQALANAERHLNAGTGDPLRKAELLSIAASTLADEGQMPEALDALERCRSLYESLSEWELLARTLVKKANLLVETEPAIGLAALDRAAPWIPAGDSYLTLLSELLRVRCLIELQKPYQALQVYRRCSGQLITDPRIRLPLRGKFTGAQLLDALGFEQEATRLFHEVVDRDVEHELYKDAFLDLLYLYDRHMKAGDRESAGRVCRRALTDPSLRGIAHEQLQTVWSHLLEAAQLRPLSHEALKELRRYMGTHWKHPAATLPVAGLRGR